MRVYFFLVALLMIRLGWSFLGSPRYVPGAMVVTTVVLDREPEVAYGRQIIKTDGLTIYASIVPELHFGDKLEISGTVGNRLIVSKPTVRIIDQNASNWWMKIAFTIRSQFELVYQTTLNRDQANLLSGIVLGNLGLDRQFKDKLANVGLTHVVAASGMNISLFSGFVLWFCSVLRLKRSLKVILTIILILFYSTVTGFAPPIVRAALMATLGLVGQAMGRQRLGVMGLLASAYLMLWADPTLLTNASFLLSFSAMTGQIILSGFTVQLPKGKELITGILTFVTKDFVQSLAVILTTFPIVMMFFAKFSLISVFTNAIVLWTVEPLMILGAIAGIAGIISVDLARIVALPTGVLLSFFLGVVDWFGRDPRFLLRIPGLDWAFVVGYYLVLGGTIWWWYTRRHEGNRDRRSRFHRVTPGGSAD